MHVAKPRVRLIIINVVFAGGSGSDNRYLVLAIYYVWGPKSQTTYLRPDGGGAADFKIQNSRAARGQYTQKKIT